MKYDNDGNLISLDSPYCVVFNKDTGEIIGVRNEDNLTDNMLVIPNELAISMINDNFHANYYVGVLLENGKQVRKVIRKEVTEVKTRPLVFDVIPTTTSQENVQIICNSLKKCWDIEIKNFDEFLEFEKNIVMFVVKNNNLNMLIRFIAVDTRSFIDNKISVPFETDIEGTDIAVLSKFIKGSRGLKII